MMPILRISERGVVRAIAKFRRFQVISGRALRAGSKAGYFATADRPCRKKRTFEPRARSLPRKGPPRRAHPTPDGAAPLPDAVAAAFQAGCLGASVVRAVAGRGPATGLRGGKPGL